MFLAETQVEVAVCVPLRRRHGSLAVRDHLGRQTHRYCCYPYSYEGDLVIFMAWLFSREIFWHH